MKKISQYLFDLERFGLSPSKVLAQLDGRSSSAPRILSVSMPKSGTNLLQRILVLHPALSRAWLPTLGQRNAKKWRDPRTLFNPIRNGKIISSHFDFDKKLVELMHDELGYKMLLMVRDPRDAVLSDMHYIRTWPGHSQKAQFLAMADDKERILTLIKGTDGVRNIRDQILRFSEWSKYAHTVRFEDAVGSGGGGSDEKQFESIKGIFNYLKMSIEDDEISRIAQSARSGKTQTFRTGRVGNWVHLYDDEIKEAFRSTAGDLLIELGYEKNLEW